jgi:uncharacterized membrane protein YcaP (DUF421 family)
MDIYFFSSVDQVAGAIVGTVIFYVLALSAMRIAGRRTLAQLSGFDVLVTILMGTVVGTSVLPMRPSLLDGVAVLVTLLLLQVALGAMRQQSGHFARLVDFRPVTVVENGQITLSQSPASAQLTEQDLRSLLRKQGVVNVDQVVRAILEPQGGISVVT